MVKCGATQYIYAHVSGQEVGGDEGKGEITTFISSITIVGVQLPHARDIFTLIRK